ncbi:hypothetical protein [Streptomyces turgidiscabies]|uniref:DUF222 domain-containing protein n=1 Tax=Streptomyces turgidiscabies TaxID=85558 RepID=A0ABU0RMI8_9ACTN|nr:hypothetical protein [Streptomyces turgidiscabies]MDQ0933202.1 hypothetical protein [Streptomyces turgidiscabies]
MRGLGRAAVSMAQAVAVLGDHAELAIAGRLAGLAGTEAASAVDRLVRRQLLVNQQPLAFRRPLIAAAIERFLPVSTADTLHSRAARVLHETGAEKAEVAEHLVHTSPGIDAWAGEILHDAGVAAMAEGRPRTARSRGGTDSTPRSRGPGTSDRAEKTALRPTASRCSGRPEHPQSTKPNRRIKAVKGLACPHPSHGNGTRRSWISRTCSP